jgi:hypothetical protein
MDLRERSHSIKLSDDGLVNQFDRKSLNEAGIIQACSTEIPPDV